MPKIEIDEDVFEAVLILASFGLLPAAEFVGGHALDAVKLWRSEPTVKAVADAARALRMRKYSADFREAFALVLEGDERTREWVRAEMRRANGEPEQ